MTPVEALQPAIALLGAGTVAALTSRALRLSPMVGYILAGIVIGPFGLHALSEGDTTHLLAELGVVFLLFDIGLHFSLKDAKNNKRDILGLAPIQMLLCGGGFSLVAVAFGISWPVAIAIGFSLALSSTAVVTRVLAERELNSSPLGQSSIAILVFQDIVAIFLLIFANSLEADPAQLVTAMAIAAGQSVVAFIAAALIGRYVVRPLFQVLASAKVPEIFTMTTVLIVVAAAVATGAIGLSLTLGAFLAGMAIADSPFRHAIQTEVSPFRGLLLSFFFVNVGLMIDVPSLFTNLPVIIALALGIMAVKTVMIFLTARMTGWNVPGATQLSFLLAQASEFTLVVLSISAIRVGAPGNWISILVASTALSLALAPLWAGFGIRLSRRFAEKLTESSDANAKISERSTGHEKPRVIVFGMTDAGRIMTDALVATHIPYVALDNDPRRFISATTDGYSVVFGDTSDFRMLETLGATDAPVLVLGEPRFSISQRLTDAVKERFPNLTRYVAVNDPAERSRHSALGMKAYVVQAQMDAIALACDVLKDLGLTETQINDWTESMIDRLERNDLGPEHPEPAEVA